MVNNYAGLAGLDRDPVALVSTDEFRRTVELVRHYERNGVDYTEKSLWSEIFTTDHPLFYKQFGLNIEEIKVFALTGFLPQRYLGLISGTELLGGSARFFGDFSFVLNKEYRDAALVEKIMREIVLPAEAKISTKKKKEPTKIIAAVINRGIIDKKDFIYLSLFYLMPAKPSEIKKATIHTYWDSKEG